MIAKLFSRRLTVLSLAIAAMCLVAILGSSATAALLAYDPFLIGTNPAAGEYLRGREVGDPLNTDVGATLGGQNPTIGPTAFYTGPWIQSGGDSEVVGQQGAPSLKYPFFPKAGSSQREFNSKFNCCIFGRNGRQIAGPGLGSAFPPRQEVYYNSFLIDFGNISAFRIDYVDPNGNPTDPNDPNATAVPVNDPNDVNTHDVNAGKRGYELWNGGVGDANLAVDFHFNYYAGNRHLTLATTNPNPFEDPNNPNDNTTTQSTLVGPSLTIPDLAQVNDGVHLVVLKFEFNPASSGDPNVSGADPSDDDVVTVYLDPTSSNEGDWTPAATLASPYSNLRVTHQSAWTQFSFTGNDQTPGAIDEIRWGETFEDVTPFLPIPEPATLALVGLSAVGMLLSRRRR